MKIFWLGLLLCWMVTESSGQLVRRKDYDAAFALQAGGESGLLLPVRQPQLSVRPFGGLKMTFPFTRKWFLGSEVNYSELKYQTAFSAGENFSAGNREVKADFHLRQLQWPVYLKYMLNCNRASVLFGFYGTYVFEAKGSAVGPGLSGSGELSGESAISGERDFSAALCSWNVGLTLGYEYQLVKHLNLMCRVSAGLQEVMKAGEGIGKKWFPAQICLTLSYDLLRIGDCGCD